MSAIGTLREVNSRLSTDDAPLWAEVLGILLAVGFAARGLAHILAALGSGNDPQLRGNDVTAASAVESLGDDRTADASARVLALSFGVFGLMLASNAGGVPGTAFIAANALVPLTDPALFLVSITRQ